MWIRIATRYEFVSVREITAKLRLHESNTRSNARGMERSLLKSLDVLFSTYAGEPRIRGYERRTRAAVCTMIAINYYGCGEFTVARQFLWKALRACPLHVFAWRWHYTLVRMSTGRSVSATLRRWKWVWQRGRAEIE